MIQGSWAAPGSRVLLRGGSVYSADDPWATAMLVDGAHVAWIGSDAAAAVHEDAADVVVELAGALVAPAFVDAHVHATSTGLALTGLDLSEAATLQDALDLLERHCRRRRGHAVLGHGWDESRWPEGRPPTRAELDRASYGGVVYLTRVDVHSAVASSALLAALPEIRGLDGFDDSGWLRRQAHHEARAAALATVTPAQRTDAQRATRAAAAALGIVALHEMSGPDISGAADLRGLLALAADEPGPAVVGYWGQLHGIDEARELGARGAAGDLFADGALGSHTAALLQDYEDEPHTGATYLTADDVRDHLVACTHAGLQGGFHVIGDAAAEAVTTGASAAAQEVGAAAFRAARHRLEHVEMVRPGQVRVLADLGVVASVQPVFDAWWGGSAGMYEQRLGGDRAAGMNPFADMSAAGVMLAFGSDCPVTPIDPWGAVRAAAGHHAAAQRISVRAAFAAHTRGGWRAAGDDHTGVLAPGAPAHYAVWSAGELVVQAPDGRVSAWSTDPRSGTPGLPLLDDDHPAPRCLRTVGDGQTLYDSGDLEETRR